MDSLAETFDAMDDAGLDLERELEELLQKEAAAQGIDPIERNARDLELWKQWRAAPSPETFAPLYAGQAGLVSKAGHRVFSSSPLPKAALKSFMMRGYVESLQTYNPDKGPLATHVFKNVSGRVGRWNNKYVNVAKIPEKRTGMLVGLYKNRHAALLDQLGREPTTPELCDDMLTSVDEIVDMREREAVRAKITPRVVSTLKREIRRDLNAESEGLGVSQPIFQDSMARDRLIFMHGSLNPDQQLVLEHSFPDWGRPVIEDTDELAKQLKMSPQKVRSIRKQIHDKVSKYL